MTGNINGISMAGHSHVEWRIGNGILLFSSIAISKPFRTSDLVTTMFWHCVSHILCDYSIQCLMSLLNVHEIKKDTRLETNNLITFYPTNLHVPISKVSYTMTTRTFIINYETSRERA